MKIAHSNSIDDIRFVHDNLYSFNLSKTGAKRQKVEIQDDGKLSAFILFNDSGERTGGLVYRIIDSGATFFVEFLWVSDSMRGTGAGHALLNTAIEAAQKAGCSKTALTTNTFQAPGFYKKYGFTVTRQEHEPTPEVPDNIHYFLEKAI